MVWSRLWVFALAMTSVTAWAQDAGSTDSEARGLFEAGRAAFDGGRFAEALEHFEAAYELSNRPRLLYNIGHAAERLRDDRRALEAFEEYLRRMPEVENRPSVEARVRALREHLDEATDEAPQVDVETAPTEPRGAGALVLMVGGAAGIAGGALALGLAAKSANEVNDSDVGTTWSSVRDHARAADRRRIAGAIVGALGVAVLAVGIAWQVSSEVVVEARAGGAALRGRF